MSMINPDFRALCAEMLDCDDGAIFGTDLVTRARAALAQPEPQGPTDEALANFSNWFCRNYPGPDTIIHKPEWHAPKVFRAAAYAIARWGTPTIQPVPVSEDCFNDDCDEGHGFFFPPGHNPMDPESYPYQFN